MIKRIRDFIYDISDVFVAIVIVIVAAVIIVWRATSIFSYSDYVTAKGENTNSSNVVFQPEDLIKDPVDDFNTDPGQDTVGGDETPGNTTENQPGTDAPGNTSENQPGTDTPGTDTPGNTTENQPGTDKPEEPGKEVIHASIKIENAKGGWPAIANRLVDMKIIEESQKTEFVQTVKDLKLDTRLQIGTFDLSSDMSLEKIAKTLCKIKN